MNDKLYYLSYKGESLPCQIVEKDYKEEGFTFSYGDNNQVKIFLSSREIVSFFWDKEKNKIEIHELQSVEDKIIDTKVKELFLEKSMSN